jgi:hypothetical protein
MEKRIVAHLDSAVEAPNRHLHHPLCTSAIVYPNLSRHRARQGPPTEECNPAFHPHR